MTIEKQNKINACCDSYDRPMALLLVNWLWLSLVGLLCLPVVGLMFLWVELRRWLKVKKDRALLKRRWNLSAVTEGKK